jgi:PAT family beta-lactamase induction signal transducer AmpG
MAAETTPTSSSWRAAWLAYSHPAALRMAFLGFAAGLPFLLLFGTLSFWLREAGIDKSTIGHLSWVGLLFAFKWVWAPLVDKIRLPLLGRLGQRRSWLLLAQSLAIAALIGMALNDPQKRLEMTVYLALALAFASATQDIALDAFRIESAPAAEQGTLAATYQAGYRLAMIWAGAGALWLAARAETQPVATQLACTMQEGFWQLWQSQPSAGLQSAALAASPANTVAAAVKTAAVVYDASVWRFAYLVMAASMGVGVLTVLFSPEPAQRDAAKNQAQYDSLLAHTSQIGVPVWGIAAFVSLALAVAMMLAGAAGAAWWQALARAIGSPSAWLAGLGVLAVGLALGNVGARYKPAAGSAQQRALAWTQASFVAPFADFLRRYGWHAVVILALIAVYRISDIVMGVMAGPFYVDMHFTKTQVASVTKIYGVAMTVAGAFVGGALTTRFGVLRMMMLGAILSCLTNLLFAWLWGWGAGAGPELACRNVWGLTLVVSADNFASGLASAAFIAYLSGLTSTQYSATQYALLSSMMVLLPKTIGGFSGEFVDAYGWGNFFTATALLGLPVLLLVALAARSQRMMAAKETQGKRPH